MKTHHVDVCIVGGGPAGMLLGLILAAEEDLRVLVLEQHADFHREYRGEVLMPRFSKVYHQLGLLDYIQSFPHTKIRHAQIYTHDTPLFDLKLETYCPQFPYGLWMPQPILLGALYDKATTYPSFDMWFSAMAQELIEESGQVVGIRARHNGEDVEVRAAVTVAADGRGSRLATQGGFSPLYDDYRFDVIWFSLPRPATGYDDTFRTFFTPEGFYLVAPKHPDLIQCGFSIPPGCFADYRNQGIEAFREKLRHGPSLFHDFAEGLTDFKPFHPLKAKVTFMKEWARDGLLLIGDAAHTCSPMGGVGVSIASETAAVAAGVVARAVRAKAPSQVVLSEVQELRQSDVKAVQRVQRLLGRILMPRGGLAKAAVSEVFNIASALHLPVAPPKTLLAGHDAPYPIEPALKIISERAVSHTSGS